MGKRERNAARVDERRMECRRSRLSAVTGEREVSYRAEQQHIRHTREQEAEAEVYTGDRRQNTRAARHRKRGAHSGGVRGAHMAVSMTMTPARSNESPPGAAADPRGGFSRQLVVQQARVGW